MEMESDEMMKGLEETNRYGKVSWILNKGLSVGKMILVAGFVISSAPVILPPFVVISAIGFACSLPYSLFLATYAFTGQFMTKLLPTLNSNLFLEYNYEDIIVEDEKQGFWKDEKQLLDDHAGENGYEEDVEGQHHKPASKAQEAEQEKPVIEQGKEKLVVGESQVRIIINEAGDEGSSSNILKEDEAPLELVTTGILIAKIRDEGKVDDEALQVEIIKHSVENVYGDVEEEMDRRNAQETGRNDNVSTEERTRFIGQKVEENVDKAIPLQSEEVKEIVSSTVLMEMQPMQDVSVLLEKKDVDDSTKGRAQRNIAYVKQAPQLITKEKELVVTLPNEDAREIADESGLHLFDGKQAVGLQCYSSDYQSIEAGIEQSSYAVYEVTLPTTVDDSKRTGITSEKDIHLAAGNGKVSYSEDKIWKQIHAMRKLVGYTASMRGTCIEELKALYVFTGVQPPASFKDPSDLVEVNDKLGFLMTIVGVK